MPSARLRQQGGAVVITVPARMLDARRWKAGDVINFSEEGDGLHMEAVKRTPRGSRTVAQLLANVTPEVVAAWHENLGDFLTSKPVGKEIF